MKALSRYVKASGTITPLIAYKATADIVSKVVTLMVIVAAARLLAPASFGLLALAMTTGWLLGVATDAGLPLYLARHASRHEAGIGSAWRQVMRLRIALAVAAFGLAAVAAVVWAPPNDRLAFVLIVAAQLLGAVLETNAHLFRGIGRSEIESTIALVHRAAVGLLAIAVLTTIPTLLNLSVALAAPAMIALAVSMVIARRLTQQNIDAAATRPALTFHTWVRDAAPIGAGILLSAIYFRCDVYFLEYWHGLETVGAYNAAFRLIEALRLFPAAALAVTFPLLCQATTLEMVRRVASWLTAFGIALMAIVWLTAAWIVDIIYGAAYLSAAPALRILAIALPLFCLNYALTHQVIGWNGQSAYLRIAAAALVTNVLANIWLIRAHAMVGAALATLITELVVAAGCAVALRARPASDAIASAQPLGETL